MKRALVIQANEKATELVKEAIGEMFAIEFVPSYSKAYELAEDSFYDVVICSVNIAIFDRAKEMLIALKKLDHYFSAQFLILSEEKNCLQLSQSFEAGCDDYLALPVEPIELKARVKARVKDLKSLAKSDYHWAAQLRFCAGTLRVEAIDDNKIEDLDLTPNEFRILFLLSRNLNRTLSRDSILEEVWGKNMHVVARTVDKHICSLRRKLGKRANYLVSVPNQGYMFYVQSKDQPMPTVNPSLISAS